MIDGQKSHVNKCVCLWVGGVTNYEGGSDRLTETEEKEPHFTSKHSTDIHTAEHEYLRICDMIQQKNCSIFSVSNVERLFDNTFK